MKQLIQKLTETFSPSGYESAIREVIRAEVKPFADEIRVDPLGNLIVRKGKAAKERQKDHDRCPHGRDRAGRLTYRPSWFRALHQHRRGDVPST